MPASLPSSSKRVAIFIGTRPEAIKMAPIVRALECAQELHPIVVTTGQHREMLRQVTGLFQIKIDVDLDVMTPNQSLASLSARLLSETDKFLVEHEPDYALVQGDTTTVLMAALACFYRKVPVGHVEAGLRTGVIDNPFPEELNRTLVTPIASLHFAPTVASASNLTRAGVPEDNILITGNTVIDALRLELARQQQPEVRAAIDGRLRELVGTPFGACPVVLITGHRRENHGAGFRAICDAVKCLALRFPTHVFVYPVHLNPAVKGPVEQLLSGIANVRLIPPQDYSHFVALMQASTVVLTDSGGVQEEAPGLGKPVLVMRDTTERPEGVDAGTVRLVGANSERIVEEVSRLLNDRTAYLAMSQAKNPYGDGFAAERIVKRLRAALA